MIILIFGFIIFILIQAFVLSLICMVVRFVTIVYYILSLKTILHFN